MTALLLLAAVLSADSRRDANAATQKALSDAMSEASRKMNAGLAEGAKACAGLEKQPVDDGTEAQVGLRVREALQKKYGPQLEGDLGRYVQSVGTKLAKGSQRQGLVWTFEILEDPAPRSHAAPGGFIFVSTGLLAAVKNEAQLAAVLGHEMGHVEFGLAARLSEANASGCRRAFSMAAIGSGSAEPMQADSPPVKASELGSMVLAVLEVEYPKDQELSADVSGLALLRKANYPEAALVNVIEAVQVQSFGPGAPVSQVDRLEGLSRFHPRASGKSPSFPKKLKWPKP